MPVDIQSISGGKDSTAMYLHGIERGRPFRSIFMDTGHEHPWTLDYIAALPQLAGGPPIEELHADFTDQFPTKRRTIREEWPKKGVPDRIVARALELCRPTGNRFLDLCILRGGFPSMKARFCTDHLKIRPASQQVFQPILKSGRSVVSWQGVRAEESPYRRDLAPWQLMQTPRGTPRFARLVTYRPLLDWTERDVWRMHRRHGIEPNPLYKLGVARVGCMPCINARKHEIAIIAEHWPEYVDMLEEWEAILGQVTRNEGQATFFPANRFVSAEDVAAGRARYADYGIRATVEWSRTARGGREYDLIPVSALERQDLATSCAEWGACE